MITSEVVEVVAMPPQLADGSIFCAWRIALQALGGPHVTMVAGSQVCLPTAWRVRTHRRRQVLRLSERPES